jgi:ribose transport system substrate-binding protein
MPRPGEPLQIRVPRMAVVLALAAAAAACREAPSRAGARLGDAANPRGSVEGGATSASAAIPAVARRQLKIALIAKSSTNPSFLAARTGAEDRARALGPKLGVRIDIEWLTPPREDGHVQAQRIAQAVAEHADAVALSCSDAAVVTPAIDDAVGRGVPVLTFDSDAPDSRRLTYIGVDDFKAGEAIMSELAHHLAPGARFAVLAGNPNAPNLRRRVEGVMHEAARHPELRPIGTFFNVETPEEASAAVIRAEAGHPEIAGWAMVGGWALYTRTLLRELERSGPGGKRRVKIVSINALPTQLPYVERGLAPVLLAQPTYLWGVAAVDALVDKVLLGRAVPARIPLDLARVTTENLGPWSRQLRAWGFVDVPEEYLRRP